MYTVSSRPATSVSDPDPGQRRTSKCDEFPEPGVLVTRDIPRRLETPPRRTVRSSAEMPVVRPGDYKRLMTTLADRRPHICSYFERKDACRTSDMASPSVELLWNPSTTFWCQEARSELCRRSQRAAKVATLLVPHWTCGEYMAKGESGGGNAETRGRRAVRLTLSQWSSTSSSGFARLANMK